MEESFLRNTFFPHDPEQRDPLRPTPCRFLWIDRQARHNDNFKKHPQALGNHHQLANSHSRQYRQSLPTQ